MWAKTLSQLGNPQSDADYGNTFPSFKPVSASMCPLCKETWTPQLTFRVEWLACFVCLRELWHSSWETLWRHRLSQISRNLVIPRWQKAKEWHPECVASNHRNSRLKGREVVNPVWQVLSMPHPLAHFSGSTAEKYNFQPADNLTPQVPPGLLSFCSATKRCFPEARGS